MKTTLNLLIVGLAFISGSVATDTAFRCPKTGNNIGGCCKVFNTSHGGVACERAEVTVFGGDVTFYCSQEAFTGGDPACCRFEDPEILTCGGAPIERQ